jgi:hypothetical protein
MATPSATPRLEKVVRTRVGHGIMILGPKRSTSFCCQAGVVAVGFWLPFVLFARSPQTIEFTQEVLFFH